MRPSALKPGDTVESGRAPESCASLMPRAAEPSDDCGSGMSESFAFMACPADAAGMSTAAATARSDLAPILRAVHARAAFHYPSCCQRAAPPAALAPGVAARPPSIRAGVSLRLRADRK